MEIGKLRYKISIEAYTPTRDSYGAEIASWNEVAKVWAEVAPLSGKEYFSSKQVNSEVTTKITIRYLEGLNTKMRIAFKNRIYDILSIINPEERNGSLVFMCKESEPNG
ncbi:MAG: phage head closure protein [Eubacteriaceae bacterium]|nr:phage head closure protein [Eubacteriaceae bacterium]